MKKILVIMVLFAAFTTGLTAQVLKPVKWQITQKKVSDGVYDIICKATVDGGWHLLRHETSRRRTSANHLQYG